MKRIFYNKLIRDRIQEKIEKGGEACEIRVIENTDEFEQELLKKVEEEAHALSQVRTRKDFLDEYADLMVVLDELNRVLDITEAELKLALSENMERKGGFSKRHFLHWSEDVDYKSNETPQGIRE